MAPLRPTSSSTLEVNLLLGSSLIVSREVSLCLVLHCLGLQVWWNNRMMHNVRSVYSINWRHPIHTMLAQLSIIFLPKLDLKLTNRPNSKGNTRRANRRFPLDSRQSSSPSTDSHLPFSKSLAVKLSVSAHTHRLPARDLLVLMVVPLYLVWFQCSTSF